MKKRRGRRKVGRLYVEQEKRAKGRLLWRRKKCLRFAAAGIDRREEHGRRGGDC